MLSLDDPRHEIIKNAITFFKENKKISITKCAEKFGIHRQTLSSHLNKEGLLEDRRSYKVNDKFFDDINNEKKAYWLGFLTADGYINNHCQLGLGLSSKDIDHIEKFKKAINSDHPIHIEKPRGYTTKYPVATIKIENKHLYNSLKKLGFCINKTSNEVPVDIDNELICHYIRGMFDGDGWFSWNNRHVEIGFGMGIDILEFIRDILEKHANIKKYDIKSFHNIFRYRISSKKEVDKVLFYIYNNANEFLNRKYQNYLNYCRLKTSL